MIRKIILENGTEKYQLIKEQVVDSFTQQQLNERLSKINEQQNEVEILLQEIKNPSEIMDMRKK